MSTLSVTYFESESLAADQVPASDNATSSPARSQIHRVVVVVSCDDDSPARAAAIAGHLAKAPSTLIVAVTKVALQPQPQPQPLCGGDLAAATHTIADSAAAIVSSALRLLQQNSIRANWTVFSCGLLSSAIAQEVSLEIIRSGENVGCLFICGNGVAPSCCPGERALMMDTVASMRACGDAAVRGKDGAACGDALQNAMVVEMDRVLSNRQIDTLLRSGHDVRAAARLLEWLAAGDPTCVRTLGIIRSPGGPSGADDADAAADDADDDDEHDGYTPPPPSVDALERVGRSMSRDSRVYGVGSILGLVDDTMNAYESDAVAMGRNARCSVAGCALDIEDYDDANGNGGSSAPWRKRAAGLRNPRRERVMVRDGDDGDGGDGQQQQQKKKKIVGPGWMRRIIVVPEGNDDRDHRNAQRVVAHVGYRSHAIHVVAREHRKGRSGRGAEEDCERDRVDFERHMQSIDVQVWDHDAIDVHDSGAVAREIQRSANVNLGSAVRAAVMARVACGPALGRWMWIIWTILAIIFITTLGLHFIATAQMRGYMQSGAPLGAAVDVHRSGAVERIQHRS